jgi:membrane protein YqaA with SNARE-associated domain
LKRRALLNVSAAILTAAISGAILYQILFIGNLLEEAGLLGIFMVSLFSHLTVIGRDLFTPAFIALMKYYNPMLLGLSAGLGGALGEVTAYYWGLGIREAFQDSGGESVVYRWIEKYGLLVILIVAASPLPDVPIVLLVGSARISLKKFLLIEAVGKSTYYSVGASIGGYIFQQMAGSVEERLLSLVVVSASVIICVMISWGKTRRRIIRVFENLHSKMHKTGKEIKKK